MTVKKILRHPCGWWAESKGPCTLYENHSGAHQFETRRIVKRVGYPPRVLERLDAARPKYSEAVKSLAAFAPDERKFYVLVSHLDAACAEARTHNLSRLANWIRLK